MKPPSEETTETVRAKRRGGSLQMESSRCGGNRRRPGSRGPRRHADTRPRHRELKIHRSQRDAWERAGFPWHGRKSRERAAPGLPCRPTVFPERELGWETRGSGWKLEENVRAIGGSHPGDNPNAWKAGPALMLRPQLMPMV